MDVMRFLLKMIETLALAMTSLLVSTVTLAVRLLSGFMGRKARHNPTQQEVKPQQSAPVHAPAQSAPSAAPAIHVHVHVEAPAPSQPAPSAVSTKPTTTAGILNQPDHAIYITTGSHLMMEHPDSERLLEALDDMLYIAAHRDGKPFTLNPSLDDSQPATPVQLPPLADFDVNVFEHTEPRPMPVADGALWLRRSGTDPTPLPTGRSY